LLVWVWGLRADALDIEVCTAREWVRIGRALTQLDVIDDAFAHGRLSYSKVRRETRAETEARQHAARQLTWWLDADGNDRRNVPAPPG